VAAADSRSCRPAGAVGVIVTGGCVRPRGGAPPFGVQEDPVLVQGRPCAHTQRARTTTPGSSEKPVRANRHSGHRHWLSLCDHAKRDVARPCRRVAAGQAAVSPSVRHAGTGGVTFVATHARACFQRTIPREERHGPRIQPRDHAPVTCGNRHRVGRADRLDRRTKGVHKG
jgi:hypothetical protein